MPWRQHVELPQTYVQPHINQLWGGSCLLAVEFLLSAYVCFTMTVLEDSSFVNDLVVGDLINCSLH